VPEPVVFISHFAIKPGGLTGYRELQRQGTAKLHAEKPRTLGFLAYLDEQGTQLTIVHVFGDADAMDRHFEGAAERAQAAYEYLMPRGWEIYGRPNREALETLHQAAQTAGVSLTLQPSYLAGFLRLG
jgi:hypothetical protein